MPSFASRAADFDCSLAIKSAGRGSARRARTCKWGRYCYRPHCTGCVDRRYAFRGRLSPGARAGIRFRREEKVTRRPLFRPAVPRSETCVRASTGWECEHSVAVHADRLSGLPITRPSLPFGSRSAWGLPICIESLSRCARCQGNAAFAIVPNAIPKFSYPIRVLPRLIRETNPRVR